MQDELHEKLLQYTQEILSSCRRVIELLEEEDQNQSIKEENEAIAVDQAKMAVLAVRNLDVAVSNYCAAQGESETLSVFSKDIYEKVMIFIKSTKEVLANPFDFWSKQTLNNCVLELVRTTNSLLSLLEADVSEAPSGTQTKSVEASGEHEEEQRLLHKIKDDTRPEIVAVKESLIILKELVGLTRHLTDGDVEKISALSAALIRKITSLLAHITERNFHDLAQSFRETSKKFVGVMKTLISNPRVDPSAFRDIDNARKDFVQHFIEVVHIFNENRFDSSVPDSPNARVSIRDRAVESVVESSAADSHRNRSPTLKQLDKALNRASKSHPPLPIVNSSQLSKKAIETLCKELPWFEDKWKDLPKDVQNKMFAKLTDALDSTTNNQSGSQLKARGTPPVKELPKTPPAVVEPEKDANSELDNIIMESGKKQKKKQNSYFFWKPGDTISPLIGNPTRESVQRDLPPRPALSSSSAPNLPPPPPLPSPRSLGDITALPGFSRIVKEKILEFITVCNSTAATAPHAGGIKTAIAPIAEEIFATLGKIMELTVKYVAKDFPGYQSLVEFLNESGRAIAQKVTMDFQEDENLIHACSKREDASVVMTYLKKSIYNQSDAIRVLTVHLLTTLGGLEKQSPPSQFNVMYIPPILASLVEGCNTLTNIISTFNKVTMLTTSANNSPAGLTQALSLEEDTNIWEEKKEADADPSIGTLNMLIERLTSAENHDSSFQKTFLITYRSFTTPHVLLEKLIQRYNVPSNVSPSVKATVTLRVCVVMKYWVETQFQDFDDELIGRLKHWVKTTLQSDGKQENLAAFFNRELEKRGNERSHKLEIMIKTPPKDLSLLGPYPPIELFLKMNEEEIAKQLALIDHIIFCSIEPSELLNQSWNKESLQFRSLNVVNMIKRLNRFSFWVSTLILCQEKLKYRQQMLTKFMTIAQQLQKINNFHSLMGIIAGLNVSSVRRLNLTRAGVNQKLLTQFSAIETMMNPKGSFSAYRKSIADAKLPAIPYIGVYLTDMTFIEDGNPDHVRGLINFKKRELIYRLMNDVLRYQLTPFTMPKNPTVYNFLMELPGLSENLLYKLSLIREPRNADRNTLV